MAEDNDLDVNFNSPGRQIDLYEALAEAQRDMGEGVFVLDDHSEKYLYVNDALCKMYGYSREELLALESCYLLVTPEFRPQRKAVGALRSMRAPVPDLYESEVLRKDGVKMPIEISIKAIEGADSKSVGLIRDITERKAKEKAVLAAHKLIDDLYNCAPCGYHSVDKNGIFIYANDTILNWLGYTREEFIGKMSVFELVAPEFQEVLKVRFSKFVHSCESYDSEFNLLRKDGSRLPVLIRASAQSNKDGNFVMSRTMTFDMTEWRKAEQEIHRLYESNLRLAAVANSLHLILDSDHRIMYSGPVFEFYTQWSFREIVGQSFLDFIGSDEKAPVDIFLKMSFVKVGLLRQGAHIRTKEGKYLLSELSVFPITSGGKRCGTVVLAHISTKASEKSEGFTTSDKVFLKEHPWSFPAPSGSTN